MPMKDRLEELHAKRELLDKGGKKSKSESPSKMSGGKTVQNFLSEVGLIESDLTKMKEEISEMKKLQQNILSTPFPEKSSVSNHQSMGEKIRCDATKIKDSLKQLENKYKANETDTEGDSTLYRVSTQQMNTLATELHLATSDFYNTQAQYVDKMKSRLKRQLSARGDSGTDDAKINELLEQDSYSIFTENYALDVQNAEQTLRDLDDRKDAILKLEQNISDMNQVFKDLNLMVADQGETLTTIEQAVDDTAVHVEGGKKQLKKAKEHQSRARRKKFCICGLILIVLLVIGIILAIIFSSD